MKLIIEIDDIELLKNNQLINYLEKINEIIKIGKDNNYDTIIDKNSNKEFNNKKTMQIPIQSDVYAIIKKYYYSISLLLEYKKDLSDKLNKCIDDIYIFYSIYKSISIEAGIAIDNLLDMKEITKMIPTIDSITGIIDHNIILTNIRDFLILILNIKNLTSSTDGLNSIYNNAVIILNKI